MLFIIVLISQIGFTKIFSVLCMCDFNSKQSSICLVYSSGNILTSVRQTFDASMLFISLIYLEIEIDPFFFHSSLRDPKWKRLQRNFGLKNDENFNEMFIEKTNRKKPKQNGVYLSKGISFEHKNIFCFLLLSNRPFSFWRQSIITIKGHFVCISNEQMNNLDMSQSV